MEFSTSGLIFMVLSWAGILLLQGVQEEIVGSRQNAVYSTKFC